ncbi:MAG: folate-binding protein YgfZ [Bauldia sp.]|uniref:CAF17-like 4Fe-4S cluster assembly/insertion protein YgfZ n=1 Tax=Bauldia sp. TaxID=2575872 RepID=UPI001D8E8E82|nr:folate-binding protein [Bauldia sp.]MCB1498108.1 folate-binding protein YgfZ [Bauldia sp.]
MTEARIAELPRRGVVAVSGPEARQFLDNLFTSNVDDADPGRAVFAGLLSPQGKLLFDFVIFHDDGRYLLDIARGEVGALLKRLEMFRLRARVDLADLSDDRIVVAAWGSDGAPQLDGVVAPDPRLPALGYRAIVPPGADMAPDFEESTEAAYDAHRIALGVPEGGIDFAFGDAFPHDADMDDLAGIDFAKGCFVGQEVVSRMKHRGTARRRVVIGRIDNPPPTGSEVTASARPIGSLGSSSGGTALALVRLDRAREAMDAGVPILAAGAPITLSIPEWANFDWPAADDPG